MKRSKQSLSHYHLTTQDMGQLTPISCIPVLPGDVIGHKTNTLIRVTPLNAPVMHQVDVRIHHFYAANRILKHPSDEQANPKFDWEDFITGGVDGMNTAKIPTITTTNVPKDLLDHLGIKPTASKQVNALPVRMYNFVVNEYYADQDLGTQRDLHDTSIARIAWGKDYFTTARPWSQKGPQLSIPVGQQAPVHHAGNASDQTGVYVDDANGYRTLKTEVPSGTDKFVRPSTDPSSAAVGLYANLANATGANPIDVRRVWGLQRFFEEAARFGNRYPEKMRRLGSLYKGLMERPEFLSGGSRPISFSEVLQTANDGSADQRFGVGDMYGHGIAAVRSNQYKRRIDEHGYVMTFLSVRPKSVYQDGVHREFLKQDREEFHDPYLEDIGMQPVYNGELDLGHTGGERAVFGYSDRYDEYRGHPSQVTATFRDKLDFWHLARKLTNPTLNNDFVTCTPDKRIFQENTEDSLWVMAHHQIACHRNIGKMARTRLL